MLEEYNAKSRDSFNPISQVGVLESIQWYMIVFVTKKIGRKTSFIFTHCFKISKNTCLRCLWFMYYEIPSHSSAVLLFSHRRRSNDVWVWSTCFHITLFKQTSRHTKEFVIFICLVVWKKYCFLLYFWSVMGKFLPCCPVPKGGQRSDSVRDQIHVWYNYNCQCSFIWEAVTLFLCVCVCVCVCTGFCCLFRTFSGISTDYENQ